VTIALAVFIIIFSVFLHELGHALYMKKYGVPIEIFSIGLPFPIKIKFSSKKILGGATLQFTPLLLGAFVQPTEKGEKKMSQLPYGQQADIYGAGPLANILFGGILLLIIYIILAIDRSGLLWNYKLLVTMGGAVAMLFLGRKLFSRFLLLPIGWFLFAITAWLMYQEPMKAMQGPVSTIKFVGEYSTGVYEAVLVAAVISIAIGVTNALPLYPFDGGRIMGAALKNQSEGLQITFKVTTGILAASLIAIALFGDFIKFVR